MGCWRGWLRHQTAVDREQLYTFGLNNSWWQWTGSSWSNVGDPASGPSASASTPSTPPPTTEPPPPAEHPLTAPLSRRRRNSSMAPVRSGPSRPTAAFFATVCSRQAATAPSCCGAAARLHARAQQHLVDMDAAQAGTMWERRSQAGPSQPLSTTPVYGNIGEWHGRPDGGTGGRWPGCRMDHRRLPAHPPKRRASRWRDRFEDLVDEWQRLRARWRRLDVVEVDGVWVDERGGGPATLSSTTAVRTPRCGLLFIPKPSGRC